MIGPGWLNRGLRDILDDEYMRALRGRAMRLGYLVTIAAVAAALIATLWRSDLALPSLSLAFNAGFTIPALYYVVARLAGEPRWLSGASATASRNCAPHEG